MSLLKLFANLAIERKLLLVSAVPIIALLILSIVTYKSVETFSNDEDRLNHVYHVQSASAEYMRLVVDLETGFRGFVLTQQPQFLQPYEAAKNRVLSVGRTLLQMVKNNHEQHLLVEKAQALVQQLMVDKDRLIDRVKEGHHQEAFDYIATEKGRALMLGVREDMARFDRREVELLSQALASSSEDRSILLGVVVGGGALALVLMILPIQLIARSITGPLTSLAKSVSSTSAGTVPAVMVLDQRDEIGDLTRVIHAMSLQIQAHIDQIKESEHELRGLNRTLTASETKYRSIVDYAPIGIFRTQGPRVIFSNRQNWIIAGRDPEKTSDPESIWEAIHPEDREVTYQAFSNATQEGVAFERVFRFLHPDGTVRTVLSRAIPINAQEVTYQGFNVDITALEQMRVQLSRSERLATLGQVAAGIAHEIRNPLVGIGSTTSLLMEEFSDEDTHKADLVTILNETKRLDRIVNQIVEYARPRDPLPAECSIDDVIQETMRLLREPLEHKCIDWNIVFENDIPPIKADRDQLKQVLLNVIQNAIDALDSSGHLRITGKEKIRNHTHGILIEVQDKGKGVDSQYLARVFEPFFTTGKRQGTGLGLAICRNIIEGHGGEIQMTSQLGSGTVVSIWLPMSHQQQFSRV